MFVLSWTNLLCTLERMFDAVVSIIGLLELLKERHGFPFKNLLLVSNALFSLKLLLYFRIKDTVHKYTVPVHPLLIDINTIAMHHGVLPVAFICRFILIGHLTEATHNPINPLPSILIARLKLIGSKPINDIIRPVPIIFLSLLVVLRCKCYLALTVLNFGLSIRGHLPLANIKSLIDVLELAETGYTILISLVWGLLGQIFGLLA